MTHHSDEKIAASTVENREDESLEKCSQLEAVARGGSDEKPFIWSSDVIINLTTLYMLMFASAWASGVPGSAIAFIAARFPEEANMAAWIATGSSVTAAVTAAIIGSMSDIFDRRSFLLFGCVSSGVGLLIGGLAKSLSMVIGGQVMNGLGIGCAFLTNPLLQEIVPKSHRPIAVGFSTLASAGSFIGAPIIEGVFIQQAIGGALEGWRVGFYVGAGIFCISFITLYFFYTPMPRPNVHGLNVIQRLLKLDWIGIFLGCFGLTLFLVGINYGGNPYEWTSGIVLGTLITGLGLLVSFGLWEWRGTSTGVLPHAVFQDRNYNTSLIIRVSGGFALYGCQAYLPQMAVYVFGTDGLTTAVWQLPLNISSISGAVLAAVILCFYKEARWISAGLLLVLAFGGGLMILVKPGINMALWIVPSILMGLAIGAEAALITIICGLTSPNELIGTAVCIGTAAGFIGASIATTMYGQISNAKVKQLLIPAISKAAVTAGLPESSLTDFLTAFSYQSADAIAAVPGATAEVVKAVTRASRLAYAEAYTYIWYTLIAFAVTSTLGCFLFTRTTHYFTNEVAAPVQERRVLAPHNRQSQAGGVVAGGEHGIERRVSS